MECLDSAQQDVIGVEVPRSPSFGVIDFGYPNPSSKGPDDVLGNFVLNGEEILEIAVVAFGPDMVAGRGLDELGGDPDALAGLAHAAFDDIAHPQFPPNFGDVHRLPLEHERGVARDNEQATAAAQLGDDVLGDAIGEILLLGIARHVGEWQHGDRGFRRQWQFLEFRQRLGRLASHSHPKSPQGFRDVLDRVLAQVGECIRKLALDLIVDTAPDDDRTRFRQLFKPGRHVDAVTMNGNTIGNHIAQVHPHAEGDAAIFGQTGVE